MIIYWIVSSTQGSSTEGTRSWVYRVLNLAPGISIVTLSRNPSLQSVGIAEVIPRQLTPSVGIAAAGFRYPGEIRHHHQQRSDHRVSHQQPHLAAGQNFSRRAVAESTNWLIHLSGRDPLSSSLTIARSHLAGSSATCGSSQSEKKARTQELARYSEKSRSRTTEAVPDSTRRLKHQGCKQPDVLTISTKKVKDQVPRMSTARFVLLNYNFTPINSAKFLTHLLLVFSR